MATTALIKVINKNGELLCTLYKHYDGYPGGIDVDINEIITTGRLTNGIPPGNYSLGSLFNGFGCFAASLIAILKKSPGDVYMVPKSHNSYNYMYEVIESDDNKIELKQIK